ncbi:MAG: hypothetical protein IKN57_08325, partial [Parasporobacterium sp.]|nr:hypothetical protein [Parasporobacterium sp.]
MWELPNPFIAADNTAVTPGGWEKQREYLKEILADRLYGEMPEAPGNVRAEKCFEKPLWDGSACFEVYDISFGPGRQVREKTAVIRPVQGKSIPVLLFGGYVEEEIAKEAISRGFCIITPLMDDAAPDSPEYREGTLAKAYPEAKFKVIAMWAWLMSRVMDWLDTVPFLTDHRYILAGHSRYGKAALCCAVFEKRAAAAAVAGSGCGGIGSLRIGGSRFGRDTGKVETLGGMVKGMFPHWFVDSLKDFGADEPSIHFKEDELPFDANFIGACIAPRPLILLEGLDDTWANPYGTLASWSASAEVYHFLGVDKNCAIHFREGGHAFNLSDW